MKRTRRVEAWRDPDPAYPYMENLGADLRLMGASMLMNPFLANTSSARQEMFRNHLKQALIIDGCAFPRIYSGYESGLKDYEVQEGAYLRPQDGQVLAVIRKYPARTGGLDGEHLNPRTTVVYRGMEDDLMHVFHIDRYHCIADGFGFENVHENVQALWPDTFIPKDMAFSHSPAVQGEKYCLGTNANVAYMTDPGTIEDAMVISESLARRMGSLEIRELNLSIRPNEHPVNLYGDGEIVRFLPDIGEAVREDGILCAFRPVHVETFAADMAPRVLSEIQPVQDRIVEAPAGARIVDLTFYTTMRKEHVPWAAYGQMESYIDSLKTYWREIIEVYQAHSKDLAVSPRFGTLVAQAMTHYGTYGGHVPGVTLPRGMQFMSRKDHPIEFLHVDVTYAVPRKVGKGFKITDRHGGKGVISRIVRDEDMPTDVQGIRADLVMDPASVSARMNTGQLMEQALNRTSEVGVMPKVRAATDPETAFRILHDWYDDVNWKYGDLVLQTLDTPEKRRAHVDWVLDNGIHLNVPPVLNTFFDPDRFQRVLAKMDKTDPEKAKEMRKRHGLKKGKSKASHDPNFFQFIQEKWDVPVSPVTFTVRDDDGPVRTVTTREPVAIGAKYVYLLCKIPEPSSPGVAHVSQHGIPMKVPNFLKQETVISKNPTRFGEDEQRIEMLSVGSAESARLTNLQATAPAAVAHVMDRILREKHPTRIGRFDLSNRQLQEASAVFGLFEHVMATGGIDVRHTQATEADMPPLVTGDLS